MASQKLQAAIENLDSEELQMDMSSMIDLVFLLLIFFMVSSTLIIIEIDKRVEPPHALNAKVAEDGTGRIVVNILSDGSIWAQKKVELPTSQSITEYVDRLLKINDANGVPTRLNIRADREVETRIIKKVIQAAGDAGVFDIIFGSYATEDRG